VLRIFIALKNPLPWPGFELATFGSNGQHTNHYTAKATPRPLPASNHRYKMSTRTSTVYKYVREHYPISNEHRGAREHQVENPCPRVRYVMYSEDLPHKRTRQNESGYGTESFLNENLMIAQLVSYFRPLLWNRELHYRSRKSATGPHSELERYTPHPHVLFKLHVNIKPAPRFTKHCLPFSCTECDFVFTFPYAFYMSHRCYHLTVICGEYGNYDKGWIHFSELVERCTSTLTITPPKRLTLRFSSTPITRNKTPTFL
jgi:hypothetical protein